MALTSQQTIPEKPKQPEQPWTIKRLFPLAAMASITKVFKNPYDVLLGYLVLILGISELLGRHTSWYAWAFTFFLLFASFSEGTPIDVNTKEEKKDAKHTKLL